MKSHLFLIAVIILLAGACSSPSNKYPQNFPSVWFMLTEDSGEEVIEESPWGFEQIKLVNESGVLKEIQLIEGGGVEVYPISEVQAVTDGYIIIPDPSISSETFLFSWEDADNEMGHWKTPNGGANYVSEQLKDNYEIIAYSEDAEEEDNSTTEDDMTEFVYIGAVRNDMDIMILFQKKNGTEQIAFTSGDMHLDADNNEFFTLTSSEESGVFPVINNNLESLYQPYTIKYHEEKRENAIAGIEEMIPVPDEYRRLDIRSEKEQSTRMLFSSLPAQAFDQTTDGLSENTKRDLLINGSTEDWNLNDVNSQQILISSKRSGTSVRCVVYPNESVNTGVMAVITSSENNSTFTLWGEEKDTISLVKLENDEFLPSINDQDFFEEETPETSALNYEVNDNNDIIVSPNTWMNEAYEGLEVRHRVQLRWTGDRFEKTLISL